MSDGIAEERHPPDFDDLMPEGMLPTVEAEVPAQQSFWQGLLNSIFPTGSQREAEALTRLQTLDDAIALYPEAASNYMLRGEVYLQLKHYELAILDFEQAIELADVENCDWGIVAQAIQDRALHGLKQTQRQLKRF